MKIQEINKKIGNWSKSAAGKASLWLIAASLLLVIIGVSDWGNLSKGAAENTNSILFGLATNLLGIVVTISFVQYYLDQQRKKDERNEEAKRILRQNRIMQDLIENYTLHYNQLTTPLDTLMGTPKLDTNKLNTDFTFTDLKDLYHISSLFRDRPYSPAIVSFYDSELTLREYCMFSLRDIEYKYYPKIGELLLNFVKTSTSMDTRDFILYFAPKTMGEQGEFITFSKWIGDSSENWVERVHSGELGSNIMLPFVSLYDMLKSEGELISDYCEEVKKISV